MSRLYQRVENVNTSNPVEISKLKATRNYFLIENRSANDIYLVSDTQGLASNPSAGVGIKLPTNQRYELWSDFAPNNASLWIVGTVAGNQQVNITEGYVE